MARKSAGLGERHRKIMEFLTNFQEDNGYSPSIREIGESIGVKSTSLVDYYLKQLEEMQYIDRDNHISRSIRILRPMHTAAGQVKRAARQMAMLSTRYSISRLSVVLSPACQFPSRLLIWPISIRNPVWKLPAACCHPVRM
jgi:SOS-response transcriptional repressor LexA